MSSFIKYLGTLFVSNIKSIVLCWAAVPSPIWGIGHSGKDKDKEGPRSLSLANSQISLVWSCLPALSARFRVKCPHEHVLWRLHQEEGSPTSLLDSFWGYLKCLLLLSLLITLFAQMLRAFSSVLSNHCAEYPSQCLTAGPSKCSVWLLS